MKHVFLFFAALFMCGSYAQDGSLATQFDPPTAFFSESALNRSAVDADNNVYVVGWNAFKRFNPQGVEVPFPFTLGNFFSGSDANGGIFAILILYNGNIVVGGSFSSYNNLPNTAKLVMFSPTTGLVTSFHPNLAPGFDVRSLAVQNGDLLVGGFTNYSLNPPKTLVRINATTGANDTTFTQGDAGVNTAINDICVLAGTNEIIVGGDFNSYKAGTGSTYTRRGLVKLSADGIVDTTFDPGFSAGAKIEKIVQEASGDILVGGFFTHTPSGKSHIVRMNATNAFVNANFTAAVSSLYGGVSGAFITDIIIQCTGNIVLCGRFNSVNGTGRNHIARVLKVNGAVDTSFDPGTGPGGLDDQNQLFDMAPDNNQDIYILGVYADYNGTPRPGFARVKGVSVLDAIDDTASVQASSQSQTAIPNVLVNDTYGGFSVAVENVTITQESTTNANITISSAGAINVAANTPAGTYTLVYKIYMGTGTCIYDTAEVTITIIPLPMPELNAVHDSGLIYTESGGAVVNNVLANDTYDGGPATTSNVIVTKYDEEYYPWDDGIHLSPTGEITVDAGTAPGTYIVHYKICAIVNPSICDDTLVYITVSGIVDAVDDTGVAAAGTPSTPISDILANDTFGGFNAQQTGYIDQINFLTPLPQGFTYNPTTRQIDVDGTVPPGIYTIQYQICEYLTDTCDTATITITLLGPNPGGYGPNNVIYDIKVQPDGYILIGGSFTTYNGITRNRIARLKPDLTLDPTFDPTGIGFNGTVLSICLSGNKILAGGQFSGRTNGTAIHNLARLNSDGSFDNTFAGHTFYRALPSNGGDHYEQTAVGIIKLSPDGTRVFAGGGFDSVDSATATTAIIKLRADNGALVSDFVSPYVYNTYGGINDIYIYPGSGMLIASSGIDIVGVPSQKILSKIDRFGNVASTFNMPNGNSSTWINSIAVNAQGKIVVGGKFYNYLNSGRNNIAKLNYDGAVSYDPFNQVAGFNILGLYSIYDLEFDADQKLIVGGSFAGYGTNSTNGIARINPDGTFDASFNTGTGFNNGLVDCIALQTDGKILVGGNFYTYNGDPAHFITRLVPGGNPVFQGRMNMSHDNDKKISIFPNPSEGIFTIDFNGYEEGPFEITVHNTLGQQIYQGTISPETANQIDLTDFQSGNYFIRMQNNKETINKIITKK